MSFDYHTATSDDVTALNSALHKLPGETGDDATLNVVNLFHQSTL
jgi:hypothetical protein